VKEKLNAILWSHGHLDHLGATPILFNKGQFCPIFAMKPTANFANLLFNDSIKIASIEGYQLGYSSVHVKKVMKNFRPINYRKSFTIGKTSIIPHDAGHITGSVMYRLENKNSILYTGDFKIEDTRLIKGADLKIEQVDVLITESTYSDRGHPNRKKVERDFIDFTKSTLDNGGIALTACFSISRSQEILLVLDEYELNYPIYIDGMSWEATKIINSYPDLQREYNILKKVLQRTNAQYVGHPVKRKRIIKEPCIIISGSGMLSGGPNSFYLKKLHNREDCSLALTGFQVPGTPGSHLLETGRYVNHEIDVKMKMRYKKFDFSSHASRSGLFKLIKKLNPEKIFCIHGDKTEEFANELKENHGFDAIAPINGESFSV
jgi:putative mRNA 3-end processing factor